MSALTNMRRMAAAVAVSAAVAGGSITAGTAPAQAAPSVAPMAATEAVPHFENVATIPGDHLAVVAPGPSDVWVALRTDEGALEMGHYDGRRWITTPVLPGRTVTAVPDRTGPRRAVLAALAPDDIWLAAGGGLAHYDGDTWTDVPAPLDAQNRPSVVTTVAAGRGRVVVGTHDGQGQGIVWRIDAGRWVNLGAPYDMPRASGFVPLEIKLMGNESLTVLFDQSSAVYQRVYPVVWWFDGHRWSSLYQFDPPGYWDWGNVTAWIVRDDWRHLFFGHRGDRSGYLNGTCYYAHRPGPVQGCQTSGPVSAAVQRKDRSVILATGWVPYESAWNGQGPAQLRLRYLDGREVSVGQAARLNQFEDIPTSQLAVEPDGMTVWAVTPLGLQRLAPSGS